VEFPFERPNEEWSRVSRAGLAGWLIFYGLFFLNAAVDADGFLFLDHANLAIHETGHPAFGIFDWHTLTMLGGTLMELLVPLGIGLYFWWMRQTTGVAFAAFWYFENFLYIAAYMGDARTLQLPLVNAQDVGDHDWNFLFSWWGILPYDRQIAGWTRTLGWTGMISAAVWLGWMQRSQQSAPRYLKPWKAARRGPIQYGDERAPAGSPKDVT